MSVDSAAAPLTKVFIVDDHEVVREGLRSLFDTQADLTVVGEAATVRDAMARIPLAHPDVAIVDLQLPDGTGAEVCRFVLEQQLDVRCLVLTSFAHEEAVLEAVRAGAAGYVLKRVRSAELVDCVRRVAAGESLLDARSRASLVDRANSGESDPLLASLTDQERTLLALVAEGLTNREIGERMNLSDKTVKNYVSSMLLKLGVSRRSGAAAYHTRADLRRDISIHDPHEAAGPIRY